MKRKVVLLLVWVLLVLLFGYLCLVFEDRNYGVLVAVTGAIIALLIEKTRDSFLDLLDTTDWKTSQRKLKRGGFINDSQIIRISFAYLFRIKIDNKYLLVPNTRNTGKYQPVGGVYKLRGNEKAELQKLYQVKDDDKIRIDSSSRDDYRLRLDNKFLRRFVARFDKKADRERISDLGREFKEELVDTGIVDWNQIQYRVCGRHMTELKFGEHFQVYELLLADVVELIPTREQESDLLKLLQTPSEKYLFATAKQIESLGVDTDNALLYERISDHTKKIIQENERNLMKIHETGQQYTIRL